MNTKQLIALWYAGIAIASLLLLSNGEIPFLKNEWEVLIIDVAIIGAISVYTFKSSNQLERKLFLRWVLPALAVPLITIGAMVAYYHVKIESLPTSELAKVKFDGSPSLYENGDVFARIYNGSSYTITKVTLRITSQRILSPEEWLSKKQSEPLIQWTREYVVNEYASPSSSTLATLTIGDKNAGLLKYEITGATGYRSK